MKGNGPLLEVLRRSFEAMHIYCAEGGLKLPFNSSQCVRQVNERTQDDSVTSETPELMCTTRDDEQA